MSLRIRIPAKTPEADTYSQPSGSEALSGRRKRTKRRLTVDSDEDNDDESPRHSSPAYNSPSRKSSLGNPHTDDAESGSELETTRGHSFDSRFLDQSTSRIPSTKSRSKQATNKADRQPAKKKRHVVSEQNSEEEYLDGDDAADLTGTFEENELRGPRKRPAKPKPQLKAPGKVAKGKTRNDLPETPALAGTKRPRSLQPSKTEDVIDVVGDSTETLEPVTQRSPSPPHDPSPPKKRTKLPTIRKNKTTGSVGQSTPSIATKPPNSSNAIKPSVPETNQTTTAGTRKPPTAVGNADFDLRNASVYAELFKQPGGSTPRSGLNRREKDEERRKELNKLRDEARAKRALEGKESFDLQGQLEKISRHLAARKLG